MSRHCSSVKSVGYDLSFIAPLPQNLTPTCRVNNSPDQMSRDNSCLKFSKPCNGHALILQPGLLDNINEINGLAERTTPGCFCYPIDFTEQFRLGSRSPGCSTSSRTPASEHRYCARRYKLPQWENGTQAYEIRRHTRLCPTANMWRKLLSESRK